MPDTKITALTAISTVDPAVDVLPIVDVSDTTMAASGTTKKITTNQILGAGGTANLASVTVTGAATAARLIVTGSTIPANGVYLPAANTVGFAANSLDQYRIEPLGVFTWYDGAGGTRMILNSTGLGLGGSPQTRFHVIDSSGVCALFTKAAAPTAALSAVYIQAPVSSGFSSTPVLNFWYQNTGISNPASECFAIRTSSADRMYFDAVGNVGVGVSTFGTSAARVLSIATGTEPTTGPTGTVQWFTSTRSANNTIPAIFTEGSGVTNAAITNVTVTNKIALKVNGTIYYLLATTSAA
jgi:hypothetical protein